MKATQEESAERGANNQHLVKELLGFSTFDDLRRSDFYRAHRGELSRLLGEPRVYACEATRPRLGAFLRVVEWNIERGTQFGGIVEVLNNHAVIRHADLLLLNELDDGMVRSGNMNVARELGRAISAHAIYGAEYLEMTKGVGAELDLAGENTAALHGNAILTRYPFSNPKVVRLPRCENNFEAQEKRLGGRLGILTGVDISGQALTAATMHLDVVNTPRCRGRQMRAMLEAVDSYIETAGDGRAASARVIIGGDLNTHTFARGNRLRAMRNTVVILGTPRDRLARRLLTPERREPAINAFARFGYETGALNDGSATARSLVSGLNDAKGLPRPMKWWVSRRIGPEGLLLEPRLDWLAARGLRALKAGEVTDPRTGVTSIDAQTFAGLTHGGMPLSDHDPIVVDIDVFGAMRRRVIASLEAC
ncbi:MAG TPA: endonuclease/exonuclease/phosphatase family protein [Blastocatellia bacterium]